MDSIRYYIALACVITLPPGFLLWFLIHPFVSFWRKIGPAWTYTIVLTPLMGLLVFLFILRDPLLQVEYGTRYPLIGLSLFLFLSASLISIKHRKHLTFKILIGIPELSQKSYPGKLLTEGVYGVIRHPRYVELLLSFFSLALFSNYLALYLVFAISLPALYFIVVLEERELRERFGKKYDDYCKGVPRFFPRWRTKKET